MYIKNQLALGNCIRKLKSSDIEIFETQSKLHIFIEDIKNPQLKQLRAMYRNNKAPYFAGNKNYDAIVNELIKLGHLTKEREGRIIKFKVNR